MALNDEQLDTVRSQRKSINDAIERNASQREARELHAMGLSQDFHTLMLTISLGLGAAIIPVLLGVKLQPDYQLFLSVASVLLLVNSIYLAIVVKSQVEKISAYASVDGVSERLLFIKLRNLLTKALLTKDEKYFIQYSIESRKIAETIVDNAKLGMPQLMYSSDISVTVIFVAIVFVARPIFSISDIVYFSVATLILWALIGQFMRLNNAFKKMHRDKLQIDEQMNTEEKDLNEFVRALIGEKKGDA